MNHPNTSSTRPNRLGRGIAIGLISTLGIAACTSDGKNAAPAATPETVFLGGPLPQLPEVTAPNTIPEANRAELNAKTSEFVLAKAAEIKEFAKLKQAENPLLTDTAVSAGTDNSDVDSTTVIKWVNKNGVITQIAATVSEQTKPNREETVINIVFSEIAVTEMKGQVLGDESDRAVDFSSLKNAPVGNTDWNYNHQSSRREIDLFSTNDPSSSLRLNTALLQESDLTAMQATASAIMSDLTSLAGQRINS